MSTHAGQGAQDHGRTSELNDSQVRPLRYRKILWRLLGYLLPFRRQVAAAIAGMLVYSGTVVALPFIVKTAIDRYIAGDSEDLSALTLAVVLFLAVAIVQFAAGYSHRRILASIIPQMIYAMRVELFAHLQRLSMAFFDRNQTGRIMSRVQNDVEQIEDMVFILAVSAANMLAVAGIVAAMLVLNVTLAAISVAVVLVLVPTLKVWQGLARVPYQLVRQRLAQVNSLLQENIAGVRVIQSLNRQHTNAGHFDEANHSHLTANIHASRYGIGVYPSVQMLTAMALALVVVVGGNMVIDGTLEVGVVIAFALYVDRLFDPVRQLAGQFERLQRAMVSADRVFELLDVKPEVKDRTDAVALGSVRGDVVFEHVDFHYTPESPVLRDVELHIGAGETVALVGPTGAGKTTLVSLLLRHYDVVSGGVTLDGQDIRDVDHVSLSRQMGVVLQEPYLFSGTVSENIRYNHTAVTDEAVERAAKAVGAHEFILDLEDGFETLLQERGSNLSVGQRQLISFARALVADPRVLILDEATANIDTYTELLIQQALEELLKDRTALVIAHRLSTVRNADRIIVLDEGRIVEQGSHEQLVAAGGIYSRLQSYTVDTG